MHPKLEINDAFLEHLMAKAHQVELDAGYGGRYDDGGASHLRELICAYRAGKSGSIPAFWLEELKDFNKKKDEEYQLYLELKDKYEPKENTLKCIKKIDGKQCPNDVDRISNYCSVHNQNRNHNRFE